MHTAAESPTPVTGWGAVVLAVLSRPRLWPTALRQVVRMAPRRWWARRPFLPLPAPDYLRFRMVTAFGGAATVPPPAEMVSYLEWCRTWPGGGR